MRDRTVGGTGAGVDLARAEPSLPRAGDIETFYRDDQWHNRVEGSFGLLGSYDRKDAAVAAGRQTARQRNVGHVLREADGHLTRQ